MNWNYTLFCTSSELNLSFYIFGTNSTSLNQCSEQFFLRLPLYFLFIVLQLLYLCVYSHLFRVCLCISLCRIFHFRRGAPVPPLSPSEPRLSSHSPSPYSSITPSRLGFNSINDSYDSLNDESSFDRQRHMLPFRRAHPCLRVLHAMLSLLVAILNMTAVVAPEVFLAIRSDPLVIPSVELSILALAIGCISTFAWLINILVIIYSRASLMKHYFLVVPLPIAVFSALVFLADLVHSSLYFIPIVESGWKLPALELSVKSSISFATTAAESLYLFLIVCESCFMQPHHVFDIRISRRSHLIVNAESEASRSVAPPAEANAAASPALGYPHKSSSIFSRLFFVWVGPLFRHGASGALRQLDNLFLLHRSLRTRRLLRRLANSVHASRTAGRALRSDSGIGAPTQQSGGYQQVVPEVRVVQPSEPVPPSRWFLFRLLNRTFGAEYYPLGGLRFLADALGFVGPILLGNLVNFIESDTEPLLNGYLYASAMAASAFLSAILLCHFDYRVQLTTLRVRSTLVAAVYEKLLKVRSSELSARFSSGELLDFLAVDADRAGGLCGSFHQLWSLPVQIAIALVLLYQQIGVAFLAGVAFAIVLIPINRWIAVWIGKLSARMMNHKDMRTKWVRQLLAGARAVKLCALERFFARRIGEHRREELSCLAARKYLDAMCVYFWATTPVLIGILSFGLFVLLGGQLTAARVFTSLSLFNMLIGPLNAFPWVVNGIVEAWVSLARLERLLLVDDADLTQFYALNPPDSSQTASGAANAAYRLPLAIQCDNASFGWKCSSSSSPSGRTSVSSADSRDSNSNNPSLCFALSGVSFTLPTGSFLGIVGRVGAGKSTLLHSLLGEVERRGGALYVDWEVLRDEGFGYAAQEPWLQQRSIRDCILFGRELDAERYQQVLHACALEEDLRQLHAGDATEVGEAGVTLSGGQRARVALARALYQDKPVYLLDDPFAAVDAHVAEHIYRYAVRGLLLAARKTLVLCTHHVHFLADAEHVLWLDEGHVRSSGPPALVLPLYTTGLSSSGPAPPEQLQATGNQWSTSASAIITPAASASAAAASSLTASSAFRSPESSASASRTSFSNEPAELAVEPDDLLIGAGVIVGGECPAAAQSADANAKADATEQKQKQTAAALSRPTEGSEEEERESGSLRSSVYMAYMRSVGWWTCASVLLSLFLMQGTCV